MNEQERKTKLEINQALNKFMAADLPEVEKLQQSFRYLTGKLVEQGDAEIELLRALGDKESLVKEQIKVSTLRHAQSVFDYCCRLANDSSRSGASARPEEKTLIDQLMSKKS
jgi:uncharacterized coiled-coil protein SlyX